MIKIERTKDCPAPLDGSPINGDHFESQVVVDDLWRMQHGKCCYCECPIPRTGQGRHVEHFRPKEDARFAHLRNDWKNLLLSCSQCNGRKGSQFPMDSRGGAWLINPSLPRMDPERHITFTVGEVEHEIPGNVMEKNRSLRGLKTIQVIRLWHPDHNIARYRFFKTEIDPILERLDIAQDNNDAVAVEKEKDELKKLAQSSSIFAGFARSMARSIGVNV